MGSGMKGAPDIYEQTCRDLTSQAEGFTEWIAGTPAGLVPGQFAWAIAWYEKRHAWYLESKNYLPQNEPESTWIARPFGTRYPPDPDSYVMKYFSIQKDERLITTNSKMRPVILLRHAKSDWWNPANALDHKDYWLCVPMFTYKDRHPQDYVLRDQRVLNPDAFYIPPATVTVPGVGTADEGAARFQAIQMIREERLEPCKAMSDLNGTKMRRPFRLSEVGLRLLVYHFYHGLKLLEELDNQESEYELFREQINALIDAATR